jgi:hypothetical protein
MICPKRQLNFKNKYELPYDLLEADEDHKLLKMLPQGLGGPVFMERNTTVFTVLLL